MDAKRRAHLRKRKAFIRVVCPLQCFCCFFSTGGIRSLQDARCSAQFPLCSPCLMQFPPRLGLLAFFWVPPASQQVHSEVFYFPQGESEERPLDALRDKDSVDQPGLGCSQLSQLNASPAA